MASDLILPTKLSRYLPTVNMKLGEDYNFYSHSSISTRRIIKKLVYSLDKT